MIGWEISRILGYLIGWLYPAYRSFKAIETTEKDDDTEWLIYWVVFTSYTVFEQFADYIVSWIPFYYELKLIVLMWMAYPRTRGAHWLFYHVVRPQLLEKQDGIDKFLSAILGVAFNIGREIAIQVLFVFKKQVEGAIKQKTTEMIEEKAEEMAKDFVNFTGSDDELEEEGDEYENPFTGHTDDIDTVKGGYHVD